LPFGAVTVEECVPNQSSIIRDDDNPLNSNSLSLPRRRWLLPSAMAAATTAFIATIAASLALAQQPSETPPGGWGVDCAGPGKMRDCRAVTASVHRQTGQSLTLEVRSPDGNTGEMVVTLNGLNLKEPVLVKVDNGAPERLIQTCINVGCYVTLTEKLIANMRAGEVLNITVLDVNKKPIEMNLPLPGFSIAFDKALGRPTVPESWRR